MVPTPHLQFIHDIMVIQVNSTGFINMVIFVIFINIKI